MRPYQPLIETGAPPPFSDAVFDARQPTLQLIYDTAPIGLAFLSPDCRYLDRDQEAGRDVTDAPPEEEKFRREACFFVEGAVWPEVEGAIIALCNPWIADQGQIFMSLSCRSGRTTSSQITP
jgi:hypothetical protein